MHINTPIKKIHTTFPNIIYNNWTSKILMLAKEFNTTIGLFSHLNSSVDIKCTGHTLEWTVIQKQRKLSIVYKQDVHSSNKLIQILCKQNIQQSVDIRYLAMLKNLALINKYITISMDPKCPVCIECEIGSHALLKVFIAWQNN